MNYSISLSVLLLKKEIALGVKGSVDLGESMFKLGNVHTSSCLDLGISTWPPISLGRGWQLAACGTARFSCSLGSSLGMV